METAGVGFDPYSLEKNHNNNTSYRHEKARL